MEISSLVKEILQKGYLLSLGTTDEKGVWVADVIYFSDDNLNIYWLSKISARHSQAIAKNPSVAGTITLSNKPEEKDLGVQLEGRAELFQGNHDEISPNYWNKLGKPPKNLEPEQAWYILRPKRIELIHQELFGHEKKVLEF